MLPRVRSADEVTAGVGAMSLHFPPGDFDDLCKTVNCSKLHHFHLQNKEVWDRSVFFENSSF